MRQRAGRWWHVAVVSCLGLLSAVQSMPLRSWGSTYAGGGSSAGEGLFNMWVLRSALADVRQPGRGWLYGNIFWPRHDALAFSDTLYGLLPPFALAHALTGRNTVVAYNLVLLAGYTAAAVAVYWLARVVGADRGPALFGAALFAMVPYRAGEVVHLQLLGITCLVVALAAAVRWQQAMAVDPDRWRNLRWAAVVGAMAGGVVYISPYVAVMTVVSVGVVVVARPRARLGYVAGLACMAAVAAAVALPLVGPLLRLQRAGYTRWRYEDLLRVRNVTWPRSFVYHGLGWAPPDAATGPDALFPGFAWCAVSALAVAVVVWSAARRSTRLATRGVEGSACPPAHGPRPQAAAPLLVMAVVCAAIGLGPGHGPLSVPFDLSRAVVPGMKGVRDSARFFYPVFVALAVAIAVAATAIASRRRWTGRAGVGLFVLAALVGAESLARPTFAHVDLSARATAANAVIARGPRGVVAELPAVTPSPEFGVVVPHRMLLSLRDGRPRIDGHSGGFPAHIQPYVELIRALPDAGAVHALRRLGVRYLLLHGGPEDCLDRYGPVALERVAAAVTATGGVDAATPAGDDLVLRLRPGPLTAAEAAAAASPAPPLVRRGLLCRPDRPRRGEWRFDSSEPYGLAADLSLTAPPTAAARGAASTVTVRARNTGTATWLPDAAASGPVRVAWRLLTGPSDTVVSEGRLVATGTARVPPGRTAEFHGTITMPTEPGRYTLWLGLVAESVLFFPDYTTTPLRLTVTVR